MKPYYEHKGITIYHGDCREIIPTLAPPAAVVTDPPYGIDWKKGLNRAANSRQHKGIKGDKDTSVRDAALALLKGVPAVVFGSFYAKYPEDVKQVLVWHKPPDAGVVGSTTGYRRDAEPVFLVGDWPSRNVAWTSVLSSSKMSIAHVAKETGHPHTKPVDLMGQIIQRCPKGVVLDPFAGSGSTLVAAKLLGRVAIGIELEEAYCEIAALRLSQDLLDFGEAS